MVVVVSKIKFRCTRFQRFFDFVFCQEVGLVMGHGDPLPASPKYDKKSWYANLKSGVGFGGSVCEGGMNMG